MTFLLGLLCQALVKARTILSEKYGSIFCHIGKPISVHEICQHCGISRIPHSMLPRYVMNDIIPVSLSLVSVGSSQFSFRRTGKWSSH